MKKLTIMLTLMLCACSHFQKKEEPKPIKIKPEYGASDQMIEMQNPKSREVVFCMKDGQRSASDCAKTFEKYGFVKLREIPFKSARYDILKTDSYPTRRWRDGELTPRW